MAITLVSVKTKTPAKRQSSRFRHAKQLQCLVLAVYLIGNTLADTKILHKLSLYEPPGSVQNEIISLNNPGTADEELVKEGNIIITLKEAKITTHAYKLIIEYRADKTGYHARYRLTKQRHVSHDDRLGVNALKAAAG